MGNVRESIAKNILFYRKKRKLSQKQLAQEIGVNNSAISNWENGINSIDIETLFKVCDVLNISLDTVFGVEDKANTWKNDEDYLEGYGTLDTHGKEIVDSVLASEVKRILEEQKAKHNLAPITYIEQLKPTIQKYIIPASAGMGSPLDDSETETIELDTAPPRGAAFAVEVRGDSMEPLYYDGDLVFVRPQPTIERGQIGVFLQDGESYVKELGAGELLSKNPKYAPIPTNEYISCFGLVIGKI